MRWLTKTADPEQTERLAEGLRAEPTLRLAGRELSLNIAHLLVQRNSTDLPTAQRFLSPSLEHLHSPYLMSGMKAAIDRLEAAIERKEPILIYGDYDVDGTTAIVILKTAIELCGGAAAFHVPHRIRDGYDMRDDVIERAAAEGVKLIISVDMGIRAFAPAETAARLGVDLIVTDHHLPGPDGVPKAAAVVNPNQPGCEYPCKSLCGAGVAFKLAQGLMERRLEAKEQSKLLMSFMKVVAIATVADAVPLTGENRVFARLGLDGLRRAVNPGLKALLDVAQLGGKPLTAGEVAFRIAPRINAAGRMDVARDVVELFSVKDPTRARELAAKLDQMNAERQQEERSILEAIYKRLDEAAELREAYCIVVDGEGWHRGVIGITATRVVERYGRPALVISQDGEHAHGSGRSIRPFHLLNALESCAHLFTRYGGHSHAVGFSLPSARVPELRAHLDAYARERLSPEDLQPTLDVAAELPLDQITPEFYRALQLLAPFGVGNHEPIFSARARVFAPPRIFGEKNMKVKLSAAPSQEDLAMLVMPVMPDCHPDGSTIRREQKADSFRRRVTFEALGWRMAERLQQGPLVPGENVEIAFALDFNDHPEFGGIELTLRDFRRMADAQTLTSKSGTVSSIFQ